VRIFSGDGNLLVIYMAHIPASSLAEQVDGRKFFAGDEEDIRQIFRESLSAVQYIHEIGFRHNDLKPANIMYSKVRGVVIVDFGLSGPLKSKWSGGGTAQYLPIEVLEEEEINDYGGAFDLWSLGVVFLFVGGKMALAESLWRQWKIADLHLRVMTGWEKQKREVARSSMQGWLNEIKTYRMTCRDEEDTCVKCIYAMLDPEPAKSPAIDELIRSL